MAEVVGYATWGHVVACGMCEQNTRTGFGGVSVLLHALFSKCLELAVRVEGSIGYRSSCGDPQPKKPDLSVMVGLYPPQS